MEAQVLDENGETHLLHVKCKSCRNAILALVLVTKAGVSSVGLVTDLSFDDVVKFRAQNKVSVDDVLAVHQGLADGSILASFGAF